MTETIKVVSTVTDGRVVLWEQHPDHPSGEIFISATGKTYDVALTVAVQQKLNRGELQQISDDTANDVDTSTDAGEGFDVSSATVAGVLGAVANGDISAEDALTQELAGKNRTTLISQLEDMIDGGNAND